LALNSQDEGNNAPSIRSPVMDKERMRPGHWLRVGAFHFLQWFDITGWPTGRASDLCHLTLLAG